MAEANQTVQDELGAADPLLRVGKRALRSLASAAKEVDHAAGHQIVEGGGTPLGFHLITQGEAVVEVGGKERRRLGAGTPSVSSR